MSDEKEGTPLAKRDCDELSEPEADFSAFFDYLKSAQGHEIAKRVLTLFEEIKKNTVDRHAEQSRLDKELEHRLKARHQWLQGIVFVVAILAVSVLTYLGKFDATLGLLFGTLVGFFFGKKANG